MVGLGWKGKEKKGLPAPTVEPTPMAMRSVTDRTLASRWVPESKEGMGWKVVWGNGANGRLGLEALYRFPQSHLQSVFSGQRRPAANPWSPVRG